MKKTEGSLVGKHLRVGVVVSRFNEFLTQQLLQNVQGGLTSCGVLEDNIEVVWVPGAFEIPVIAKHLSLQGDLDAVVCLGVILKGETDHDKLLAESVTHGIEAAARETGVPMVNGVLHVESGAQASERMGGRAADRGKQFALTAVEMANLVRILRERGGAWHNLFSKT